MTVPMWSPFAFLIAVCALPSRATLRRVDWLKAAVWTSALVYCFAVWAAVGLIVWWLVW